MNILAYCCKNTSTIGTSAVLMELEDRCDVKSVLETAKTVQEACQDLCKQGIITVQEPFKDSNKKKIEVSQQKKTLGKRRGEERQIYKPQGSPVEIGLVTPDSEGFTTPVHKKARRATDNESVLSIERTYEKEVEIFSKIQRLQEHKIPFKLDVGKGIIKTIAYIEQLANGENECLYKCILEDQSVWLLDLFTIDYLKYYMDEAAEIRSMDYMEYVLEKSDPSLKAPTATCLNFEGHLKKGEEFLKLPLDLQEEAFRKYGIKYLKELFIFSEFDL